MSEAGKVSLPAQKLKKGDRVVMQTCGEAESHQGKIWTCKTDQFNRGTGVYEQDSVFLEGYSGSFAPEFLQKVVLPSEDESLLAALEEAEQRLKSETHHLKNANYLIEHANKKLADARQQVKDLKEEKQKIFAVHEEQCARSSEYYNELIFVKGKMAEAQQTIARLKSALTEIPEKAMQIDSFADCDTVSTFPMYKPSYEEQESWFDEYCAAQADHIKGLIADALEGIEERETQP